MRSCIASEVQPVTLGSPRQQTTEVLSHFQVAFPDPKQTELEAMFQGKYIGPCANTEGGGGDAWGPDPLPLKNHKNIGFLSNSGPDPLKNYTATVSAFNVGASSARAKRHLNGVSLVGR